MKRSLCFAGWMMAGALVCAGAAVAQTKSGTQTPPPKKAAPAASYNRALLNPAALNAKAPAEYEARFTTTKGDFVVKVTREWAPLGADRFYNLVKNGFYDNMIIFRVVPGFVTQFGISGYPRVAGVWERANIKDDPVKASNARGMITYAKSNLPNSRTTQVFINYINNARLDGMGFAPFGQVTQGMEIVDQLYGSYADAPTERQDEIAKGGNAFLEKEYPKLDKILKAVIVGQEAGAPAKAPAKKTP